MQSDWASVPGAEVNVMVAVVGFTVTVKLQVAVFPEASVTVQITVVIPKGNTAPANVFDRLKLLLTVAPGQLSLKLRGLNSFPTTV